MKETKIDIYPGREEKSLTKELALLKKATISSKNKELIGQFQNYLFSTGSGSIRVAKVSSQLRTMARWTINIPEIKRGDFDQFTRQEALTLVSFINRLPAKSEVTKADYRRAFKQFYRWFKEEDSRIDSPQDETRIEARKFYQYLEKEVSITYKAIQADPKTILTEQDISQVLEACQNARDKAFIAVLHETGMRAGEILNLKIGDLNAKDGYLEIHVPDGKTGKRTVFAQKSLSHVLRYLDVHPYKENENAPLWTSIGQHNRDEPILYIGAMRILQRCFNKAGVKKRHNLHWFRHSRATLLAPKMTETMLCKYMGWSIGSRQVKTYIHLCSSQLEDTFLAIHGIKAEKEEAQKPVRCLCGSLNRPGDRYCYKCFKPLSVEVAIQDHADEIKDLKLLTEETMRTFKLFLEIQKDPELRRQFEDFQKLKK